MSEFIIDPKDPLVYLIVVYKGDGADRIFEVTESQIEPILIPLRETEQYYEVICGRRMRERHLTLTKK